jgi:hypothetical protein
MVAYPSERRLRFRCGLPAWPYEGPLHTPVAEARLGSAHARGRLFLEALPLYSALLADHVCSRPCAWAGGAVASMAVKVSKMR